MGWMVNDLNSTELQSLARSIGIEIPKTMDPEKAMDALAEGSQPKVNTLAEEKQAMEKHIQKYIRRLKSQLPDCPGKCTSHGCPDIVVSRCWLLFKDHLI